MRLNGKYFDLFISRFPKCTYMDKNMHLILHFNEVPTHKYCLKPCLEYLQIKTNSCKKLINIISLFGFQFNERLYG